MRDLLESLDKLTVQDAEIEEASGEFAVPFYQMQDEYCGGDCPSEAHKVIIDSLVQYMSGDDIMDFVMQFRREHDMDDDDETV